MRRAVDFWSAALGYRPRESGWDPEFMMLEDPEQRSIPVSLQLTFATPTQPVRVHLDLYTGDQDRQAPGLEGLGATRVEDWPYPQDADFVVLSVRKVNEPCVTD